jgi:N-methylhydantoinase B/oxoprolinase/acetone carboxylase alpha subunit
MKCKTELRNFIEHYGLDETEEALAELKKEAEEIANE